MPTTLLEPLPYHRAVAEILEREQPQAFATLRPPPARPDQPDAGLDHPTVVLDRLVASLTTVGS